MSLTDTLAPADEAGVAAVVAEAFAARTPLAVEGNGSKRALLRPVQAARTLSLRNLTGITLYRPQELIISARAGTPVPEIEATLAEHGQHLIAEPPAPGPIFGAAPDGAQTAEDRPATLGGIVAQATLGGIVAQATFGGIVAQATLGGIVAQATFGGIVAQATLGGIVAANLSGPRRIAGGAMRDHVMGIRAVNGRGEVFRSGGRVLKNVTGLDLCKLLTGAHGTLGVITEITLKVLPAPEATGSLAIRVADLAAGVAALSAGLGSPYGVSGAALLPAAAAARIGLDGPVALLRLEDFADSVAYRSGRLAQDLAPHGAATVLDDATSRAAWRAVRDAGPLLGPIAADEAVWRLSTRPSAGPAAAAALGAAFGARLLLDWGGGLVWAVGPATEAAHQAVVRAAHAAGGAYTLFRAPEPLRAAVAVLPEEPPALAAIGRRVKAALDPAGVLNPGRMVAGL